MFLRNRDFDFATDALFLDFDGTLVDLALQPDGVVLPVGLIALLSRLQQSIGGALAVVSGRPLSQLDHYLTPLRFAAAGVHGLERRDAQGEVIALPVPDTAELLQQLKPLVERYPGLLLERKYGALALHYRKAPDLQQTCIDAMQHALSQVSGFTLLRGKMVLEAKAAIADKGGAVAAFMAEAPFFGRRPWFIGDDMTDEAGFSRVQESGGIGVKIGVGSSQAQRRLESPAALLAWLSGLNASTR